MTIFTAAHLVASGVKGLTPQSIRVTSPNSAALTQPAKGVQLVGALPRNTQLQAGVKARGLIQQRITPNNALKMTTNNASQSNLKNSL